MHRGEIGRLIVYRRDKFILVSRIDARDRVGAAEELGQILYDLKTDNLDCLLMHAVASMDELEAILSESSVYETTIKHLLISADEPTLNHAQRLDPIHTK